MLSFPFHETTWFIHREWELYIYHSSCTLFILEKKFKRIFDKTTFQ